MAFQSFIDSKLMSTLLNYLDSNFVINGRYRIVRRIGAGGFAVVFEAFDLQIDRPVAVKVLHIGLSGDEEEVHRILMERFEREAKLAARVEHPNVVSIYDFGIIEGHNQPFIVMELLKGHDLEHQIYRKGVMAPSHIIPLYIGCLTALGIAHSHGIIHKDLKPSNLFLKNPGERFETLCIVDFGIAYINEAVRERLTQDGQLLGTPSYLTPEYITDRVVSPPLDVYQMALILIEALLGEPIVEHPEHLAAMLKHVRGELHVPRSLLESPLGPVLRRALAYYPAERYADALEFADALGKVDISQIPIPTLEEPRDPVNEAPEKWSGRKEQPTPVASAGEVAAVQAAAPDTPQSTPFQPVEADAVIGPPKEKTQALPAGVVPIGAQNIHGEQADAPVAQPPAAKSRKALVGVLGLVGLVAVLGIVLAMTGGGPDKASQNNAVVDLGEAAVVAENEASAGSVSETGGELEEQIAENVEEEQPEEPAAIVEVLVTSTPPNARVFQGEDMLGNTPLAVSFLGDDVLARTLRLSLEGFQDLEVVVTPEHSPEFRGELVPQLSAAAPAKEAVRPAKTTRPAKSTKSKQSREERPAILLPNF